ncbi:outer membrane lipoprotein carrier protein LolA [Mucilaginibacter sp.]|uniref:LolA family protein n=1 Tax=Mucilaginibacter sp. TaxID=1882438 RepID=UPI0026350D7A|nr:outer membrane lipoprotein carrier protein LolA [Mucilaginibacter sp.]MDB5031678.1 lipoprotein chaperone [Mucilaginibacter sp.]
MKKLIIYTLIFISATKAFAQKDAQAKIILNQVSQKYKQYAVIKSDFTFTIDAPQASVKQTQNGTLITQSKTNKFKITLFSAAGSKADIEQEIISDGKTQWTYLKKDKEVQVSDADHSSESFSPAQLFTMYEHGYKYIYTGEQRISGKIYQTIDLTPEDDDKKQFFKIRLQIDKVSKQIYTALIFDKNGNKYTYTLRSFIASPQVPDNTFIFDTKAHPGVEVVDLR